MAEEFSEYPVLHLRQGRDFSLLNGHPWVFSGAFQELPRELPAGNVVDVVSSRGEWVARGHINVQIGRAHV